MNKCINELDIWTLDYVKGGTVEQLEKESFFSECFGILEYPLGKR